MLALLGYFIAKRPGWIVLAWALAVGTAVTALVILREQDPGEVGSFLPADSPHAVAQEKLREAFPEIASRSQIVIVACRESGLTEGDLAWLGELAGRVKAVTRDMVLSPAMPFFDRRLRSEDGQAALVVANLQGNFISLATSKMVNEVEQLLGQGCPPGLGVELSGIAGIGRDYALAAERAAHRTTWVTVLAVLIILVFVYRSPVGALVPLISIGVSAYLAFGLIASMDKFGVIVSDIERVFTVVLIFGAGVDYVLFWIARYRESLEVQPDLDAATMTAVQQTGPAIIASAATTICGLSMLMAAEIVPTRNAGRVLGPVLVLAMLAAMTLAPAMARLMGRALLWPLGFQSRPRWSQRAVWPRVAGMCVAHPGRVLIVGLLLLGTPALWAMRLPQRFDALSELPPGSSSERGFKVMEQHFSTGQLFSTQMLLVFQNPDLSKAGESLTALARRLRQLEGVEDVYSPQEPLGTQSTGARLANALVRPIAQPFYSSKVLPAVRLEIMLNPRPFSDEAMVLTDRIREVARSLLAEQHLPAEVYLAGLTPYIMDVRVISRLDQIRVMVLATVVIALVVVALVKNIPLTIFMLAATWLTYGATLTISTYLLSWLTGVHGLDWKVNLIVFVIVMAVGQDYNIFLVSRLLKELENAEPREATRRAMVQTGSVISNCGLIMAATLGSLWAGKLLLLQQVGLALAVGVLVDTFIVRPVLLPSFFMFAHRWCRPHGRTLVRSRG